MTSPTASARPAPTPGVPPAADLTRRPGAGAAWERLADESGSPPSMRPGWIDAWRRAFGAGSLELLSARASGDVVAVVPMERRGGLLASPTNWHTPSFELVAPDSASARSLADVLLRSGAHHVALRFVDPEGRTALAVRAAAEGAGWAVQERVLERSPFVDLSGGWEAVEDRLDRKVRSELGRRRRRLAERGPVDVTVVTDPGPALDRALAELLRVEASGWKGRRGTAIASDPATESFYRRIAGWAAERGWLRLVLLTVGGHVVAGDLSLRHGDTVELLKTGYDEAWRSSSPGMLLRREAIRLAAEEGATTYDFLGDDQPWKRPWASGTRDRVLIEAFAPTIQGRGRLVAHVHARPLAKRGRDAARAAVGSLRRRRSTAGGDAG